MLVLALALAGCASAPKVDSASLTVVHTNDTHGRILEGKYDGMGFAKVSSYVKGLEAEGKDVLLLDGGDTTHGMTLVSLSEGAAAIEIMNTMGYDAMVPGNHDFNYGWERLVELAGMANFPIVCANVVNDETGETILPPYTILDVNGMKVGIFGLTTEETLYKSHPKNTAGLTFLDPVETSEKMVKELRKKVNVLIALGHLGLDEDTKITSKVVMDSVEGIDLFIDGHSHTPLPEGLMAKYGLIAQAGEYDKFLGVDTINVNMGEVTAKASLYTKEESASLEDDAAVISQLEDIKVENDKITEVVVGHTDVYLDGERNHVRTGATNLGDMICAALIDVTGADFSLQNGGGIRASIEAGDVTKGDVITVLPFGNTVTVIEVTGADIKAAIENGIKAYPEPSGGFCHFGGLTYTFDQSKPAGSRVTEILVKGSPIDPAKNYSLATNDFTAAGGDEYTMLAGKKVLGEYGTLDDILVAYMNK